MGDFPALDIVDFAKLWESKDSQMQDPICKSVIKYLVCFAYQFFQFLQTFL